MMCTYLLLRKKKKKKKEKKSISHEQFPDADYWRQKHDCDCSQIVDYSVMMFDILCTIDGDVRHFSIAPISDHPIIEQVEVF